MADVRVGVVSWNTAQLLGECLDSLPGALEGLDFEVVVVDNNSADDSAEVAEAHGATVIRNENNVGYARAMNQALAGTDAPVLIALNPDTRPTAGSLAALVRDVHAHPTAALVVPRLVNIDGTRQHSVYRFPTIAVALVVSFVPGRWQRGWIGRRWWLEAARPHDTSGPVDWAIGAVHVIRASALEGQAPYSERWFMYVEDLELCWRLHRRGSIVHLDAQIAVPHVGNASGAQRWGATRARRYWANTYDFDAGARGRLHARAFAAVNVAGVGWAILRCRLLAAASRSGGAGRRTAAADLQALLPVHVRAFLAGPPQPDSGAV